jgi:hypothetical protein
MAMAKEPVKFDKDLQRIIERILKSKKTLQRVEFKAGALDATIHAAIEKQQGGRGIKPPHSGRR